MRAELRHIAPNDSVLRRLRCDFWNWKRRRCTSTVWSIIFAMRPGSWVSWSASLAG